MAEFTTRSPSNSRILYTRVFTVLSAVTTETAIVKDCHDATHYGDKTVKR